MPRRLSFKSALIALGGLAALVLISALARTEGGLHAGGASADALDEDPTIVGEPVTPGIADVDLRSLPSPGWQPGDPVDDVPLGIDGSVDTGSGDPGAGSGQAAAAQALAGPVLLAVTPASFLTQNPNFEGIAAAGRIPPDTVGDIGSNHYIQMVNGGGFQIWDKAGNSLAGPVTLQSLYQAAAVGNLCRNNNNGDGYVNYDHLADRWVVSQFAVPNGTFTPPTAQCFAISRTADPVAGGWYLYEFTFTFGHDYPKVGVWPDGYYMSSQQGFPGGVLNAVAFDRANMLNGNPATFQARTSPSPALTWLPSDLDGPAPPAGTPNFFSRQVDGDQWGGVDRVEVMAFTTDWQNPANTSFTAVASLPAVAFDSNMCAVGNLGDACVPQPGTAQLLDILPHWPMGPLQYRNFGTHETLVFNHTVDVDGTGHAGVRWYELRRPPAGAWSIFQQGTQSPDAGNPGLADDPHRWMGSVAMDQDGNMALGYNVSSTTVSPGIAYAGRFATDPLGLMPQGAPPNGDVTLQAGGGSQTPIACTAGPCGNRWGDYSAMRVDPVDNCTFWFTSEYIAATSAGNINWQTRIGAFSLSTCNSADLSISKFDYPDPVNASEQLYYDVYVTNHGPAPANNVVVTDVLPSGVDFVTDTDTCSEAPAGTLTCNLTPGEGGAGGPANCSNATDDDSDGLIDLADPQCTIAALETRTFTIKVDVDSDLVANAGGPTVINNAASVTATQVDPDLSNNQATASTIVEDSADLAVTKECKPDQPIAAGATATCTIWVDNLGPSDARNVTVTDTHVSNGAFSITDADASPGGPCVVAGGSVTCDLGTEPAGGRTTIVVTLSATEAQDVNDCASVASDTLDPDTSNNQSCDGVSFFGSADLSITKADSEDPLVSGTSLTYTLTVHNNGPSTAVNVRAADRLPAGVAIVSVSGTGGASCVFGVPGDVTRPTVCNFDSIAPGATETMTLVVTVLPGAHQILQDDARVSSDTYDPNNANDIDSENTAVQVADIQITKTSAADTGSPSQQVAYTLTVRNNGPGDAQNVVVTDNLPLKKTDRVFWIPGSPTCSKPAKGTLLTCNLGTVPAASTRTITVVVVYKGNRGIVSNTANVTTTTFDFNMANNSSTKLVLVGQPPKP